ncbi:MAG TPA: hypothetical protein VHC98_02440 [Candidatus Saccharimonadales bacterium]|nr:hypothetical protein [Candidatus Saccharimonadales bacterium]
MSTRFIKLTGEFPKPWMNFSGAGQAWLDTLHLLLDHRDEGGGWGIFYVEPTVVAFVLELFAKSLAAHEDPTFDARKFGHATSSIIAAYSATVPLFATCMADESLMATVREYEKTTDVKYGEMSINLDGNDSKKLIDAAYAIRAELYRRTSVNYLRPQTSLPGRATRC